MEKKYIKYIISIIAIVAAVIIVLILLMPVEQKRLRYEKYGKLAEAAETNEHAEYIIEHYDEYPEYITRLFYNNPDNLDFVYNYAFCKDNYKNMTYTEAELNSGSVPALYMFDERWGYETIGNRNDIIKTEGCAYVSLTMAYIYLTGKGDIDPVKLGNYADNNGLNGKISAGILIENIGKICEMIGLKGEYHNYDAEFGGTPVESIDEIAALMGEGKALIVGTHGETFGGHALVIREIDGNMIYFNDPASEEKTAQAWNFDDIKQEIMAVWVITNK